MRFIGYEFLSLALWHRRVTLRYPTLYFRDVRGNFLRDPPVLLSLFLAFRIFPFVYKKASLKLILNHASGCLSDSRLSNQAE